LIYENYAKYSTVGRITFWYFSGIWGLYGIASVLSYKYKNIFYNILDLFSKNFFGIFLAVVLWMQH
jgi:bacteriorhodopsin